MLKVPAILDPGFAPLSVLLREYSKDVKKYGKSNRFVCSIERSHGHCTAWERKPRMA